MCRSCVLLFIYLLYDGFLCWDWIWRRLVDWLVEKKKQNGRRAYFLMGRGS